MSGDAAQGQEATWEDLFGEADEEMPPGEASGGAAGADRVEENKGKKEKKEKKEKKAKKEKGTKSRIEPAAAVSPAAVGSASSAQVSAPTIATSSAPVPPEVVKDKKQKKDKEKKAKKDKRAEAVGAAPFLPVVGESPSAQAPTAPVVLPSEGALPEVAKKRKEKKEKKIKKSKEVAPPGGGVAEEPKEGEGESKSKKQKKDKDKGKKEKKDKKDKKRKAEEAGLDKEAEVGGLAESVPAMSSASGPALEAGAADDGAEELGNLFDIFDNDATEPAPEADDKDDNMFAAFDEGGRNNQESSQILNELFGEDFHDEEAPAMPEEGRVEDGNVAPGAKADAQGEEGVDNKPEQMPKPKRKRAKPAEEDVWPEAFSDKFMKVLMMIRAKKPLTIKDEEAQSFVQEAVQRMFDAAKADDDCFGTGQPAENKMRMLPKVVTIMNKYHFAVHFVTFDGCKALAAWLKPLPNGALPNVHLRTELLHAMSRLPITKEALASCSKDNSLGAIVAKMQHSPHETIANRKIASMLVQSWVKQVLSARTDTGDAANEVLKPKLTRPPPETEESLRLIEVESERRIHPAVPVIQGKEYVIKPVPRHQPVPRDKTATESNRGKISEVLKVMARPNKKAWKPFAVSIAGRQMNAV